jgi:hypothetical protein
VVADTKDALIFKLSIYEQWFAGMLSAYVTWRKNG